MCKTRYQEWKDAGGKLTPLPPLWQKRRERLSKQVLTLRPYLAEAVADGGDAFSLGSLLGVVLFVLVIGSWLWSARGLVGTMWAFVTGGQPSMSAPRFEKGGAKPPALFSVTDGRETSPPVSDRDNSTQEASPAARPDVRRTGGGSGRLLYKLADGLAGTSALMVALVLACAGCGLLLLAWGVRLRSAANGGLSLVEAVARDEPTGGVVWSEE